MSILSPAFALAVYGVAILTALLVLRCAPLAAQDLEKKTADGRLASIDGLRGYLAWGVLIHHLVIMWFFLHTGKIDFPPSKFYTQIGQVPIALFFMITAFLFWGRLLAKTRNHDWLDFAISRLFRLYPLYLPLLAVIVVLAFWLQGWQLQEPRSALFRQIAQWLIFERPDINLYPHTVQLISGVTWTLSYELLFYLALPLLALIVTQRVHWIKALLCMIGVYALYRLVGWNHGLKAHFLWAFLGGISAAYWVRHPALAGWSKTNGASVIALLLMVVAMVVFGRTFKPVPLLTLTVFFSIVASGNSLFRLFASCSVRWLGEISYSTYLLHGLILWLIFNRLPLWIPIDPLQPSIFLALSLISSMLLVLASSMTFVFIERPGIALGRRVVQRLNGRKKHLSLGVDTAP